MLWIMLDTIEEAIEGFLEPFLNAVSITQVVVAFCLVRVHLKGSQVVLNGVLVVVVHVVAVGQVVFQLLIVIN